MKRISAGVLAVTLILTMLAGCGTKRSNDTGNSPGPSDSSGQQTAPPKPVKIAYARGKDDTTATKSVLDAFMAKFPHITVEYLELPNSSDQQREQYVTKLSAGDTSIDVMSLDIIWVSEFAAANWTLPLDEYFPKSEQDKFLQGPLDANRYNGKLASMPLFTSGGVLYYRKDILDKYGKQPPKTWDEMIAISKEIVGKDGIEFGYVMQAAQYEGLTCNIYEMILSNGGSVIDASGKVAVNSSNTVEAIKFMQRLVNENIVPPGATTHREADAARIFFEGKALFLRHWAPAYANIQNNADSKVKDKVGIANLPMGPKGTVSSSTIGGWNVAINANVPKDRLPAAVELVKFMTSEEAGKIYALEASSLPVRPAIYNDLDILKVYPHWADFGRVFATSVPRPVTPSYPMITESIQINVHKAISGQLSAEDAAKNMQADIEKVIKR